MRNLKRVLSLALAALMLMGMMVVGAGAASKDFTDSDEIKNVEAVDVMVALGVLEGGDKGDFQPNSILTREQAAKIICYMLLGTENAEKLVTSGAVFSDVAANRWSAPYIAYCVNMGILAGDGNGHFFPEGKLTGAAFAKMLLVALGYDASIEKYVGNVWTINVATGALDAGILPEGLVLTNELSRQDAAQMAFQTLTATMVEYDNAGTSIDLGNGGSININPSKAKEVTYGTAGGYDYTDGTTGAGNANESVQFCEKYFKGLRKNSTVGANADDFRRPGFTWYYNNEKVLFVADTAALTYTAALDKTDTNELNDVKAQLVSAGVAVNSGTTTLTTSVATANNYKNGTGSQGAVANVGDLMDLAGNGKKVEVFVDDATDSIKAIVATEYSVGQVTTLTEGVKAANGSVYTNYGVTPVTGSVEVTGKVYTTVKNEESNTAVVYSGIAKEDVVTYVVVNGILYVYPTEQVVGVQTAKKGNTITVDGTQYTVAAGVIDDDSTGKVAATDFANTDKDNNYYLDQYGYAVYTNAIGVDAQYCVVDKIALNSGIATKASAVLVFADGSTKEVTVDKLVNEAGSNVAISGLGATASRNTAYAGIVYTYVVNDNGNYELTAVTTGSGDSIAKETVSGTTKVTEKGKPVVDLATDIVADNKTVFVVKTNDGSKDIFTAYTGFQSVPTIQADGTHNIYVDYAKDGSVKFVYIDASAGATMTDAATAGTMVYITNATATVNGVTGKETYTYDAIIDGKVTTITTTTTNDSGASALAVGLYKVTVTNSDGNATSLVKQNAAAGSGDDFTAITNNGSNISDAKNGVLKVGSTYYTYDGEETVYFISADGTVSTGSVDSVKGSNTVTDKLFVKLVSGTTTNEIDTLYVVLK